MDYYRMSRFCLLFPLKLKLKPDCSPLPPKKLLGSPKYSAKTSKGSTYNM